ncbi:MAG: hypothetical protein ACJA2Q_000154 [Pseudohongiellaceae bacterium]|jgi:hypothetical protein
MFSKLIITVFVIAVAFVVLRQRNINRGKNTRQAGAANAPKRRAAAKDIEKDQLSKDMRIGAYLFLLLTACIGGTMYYFQWQDDHSILTINLYRDSQVEPISYEVYKYQLREKSFITIDGLSVAVAGSERMEIIGLE